MPIDRDSWKSALPYLLLGCGSVMAFLGARDFFESYYGQAAAERTFRPAAASVSAVSLPQVQRPRRGDTVARLSIPRLSAQLYVIEGDDTAELRRGPGHLADSAPPGTRGNCVIAGHRDTHFRVLKNIRKGDDIFLDTDRGRFRYRVAGTAIVSPTDTGVLRPTSTPVLTLVTCYPFYYVGASPKRFIVEATLAGNFAQKK